MNERIKALRKQLGYTQQEFADRLHISRNNIATYETGKSNPGDSVIALICRTFNVSETWLRAGTGDPFIQRDNDEEFIRICEAINVSDDELIKRIIKAYWYTDEKGKAAIRALIDSFTAK